ncbi:uncharacterized protein NPIL_238571 [Nephila pilipes]|uniref:Uncharacterized protein n=1 Tax=Nephila pilipes TaxID=299642 RepID=A0A8X6NY30_NEPPI|nr:uncharacterized protein NPIL_238571 [Nephila pilipes]
MELNREEDRDFAFRASNEYPKFITSESPRQSRRGHSILILFSGCREHIGSRKCSKRPLKQRNTSRIFKIFVVILCSTGFLYQSGSFLSMYFEYPTVVDVQVNMPREMILPAVTYCNINGIALYKYCLKYSNACHTVNSKKYVKRYPPGSKQLKTIINLMIPYSNITRLFFVPQEEILKYSNTQIENNTIVEYRAYLRDDEDNVVKESRFTIAPSVRSALRNPPICMSFNVIENPANQSLIYVPASYTMTTRRLMSSHTYVFGPQYGAYQISVHSPYNYNNPFVNGYETREGMSYYLDFSVVIKKTLPKPYETDCFDYLGKLKKERRPGPTNQKVRNSDVF